MSIVLSSDLNVLACYSDTCVFTCHVVCPQLRCECPGLLFRYLCVYLPCCLSSAQIQQLKHSVPKGDKKRKRDVASQVAQLEAQLEARHESELNQLAEQQKVAAQN